MKQRLDGQEKEHFIKLIKRLHSSYYSPADTEVADGTNEIMGRLEDLSSFINTSMALEEGMLTENAWNAFVDMVKNPNVYPDGSQQFAAEYMMKFHEHLEDLFNYAEITSSVQQPGETEVPEEYRDRACLKQDLEQSL